MRGQVVGDSPETDHGRMGVGVDEPWQDQASRGINRFFCRVGLGRIMTGGLHQDDVGPADPDPGIFR